MVRNSDNERNDRRTVDDTRPQPPVDSFEKDAWTPGVVHVVFRLPFDREALHRALSEPGDSDEFLVVGQVAREFGLLQYVATFSFTPPGVEPEKDPPPGRDRYYTFVFPPDRDVVRIAERLRQDRSVERAAPAPQIAPPSDPFGDPFVNASPSQPERQWYIPRCKINQAWQLKSSGLFSGQGIVVADIDWGFLITHPEFSMRIECMYNSIDGTTNVSEGDQIQHGTAVLGLLGAGADGQGMAGVAYGASLWAIQADDDRVHQPPPPGPYAYWAAAVDHVRTTNSGGRRKIICLEAETKIYHRNIESDIAVNKAIRDAIAANVIVCVPAGNAGEDAGLDANGQSFEQTESILVGATVFNSNPNLNEKAEFSNWGERVVISAPGDRMYDLTCSSGDDLYRCNFGQTSGSTPKVAGAVALMLEANPKLTHPEIRSILKATGSSIAAPPMKPIGAFLDACEAVKEAQLRAAPHAVRLAKRILAFVVSPRKQWRRWRAFHQDRKKFKTRQRL